MGWLVSKTYLRWREPAVVRGTREALEEKTLRSWVRPLWALLLASLLLLQWFFATLNPNKHPPPLWQVLPLVLGFGMLLVYAVPLLYRLCPSYIRVTEAGVTKVVGNHAQVWKYGDLQSCRIVSAGSVSVLELKTAKGPTVFLGVARSVGPEKLCQVLATCGVQVSRVTASV